MLYLRRKVDRPFGVEQWRPFAGRGTGCGARLFWLRRSEGGRMPLRVRLALLFALATAVVVGVAGVAFVL